MMQMNRRSKRHLLPPLRLNKWDWYQWTNLLKRVKRNTENVTRSDQNWSAREKKKNKRLYRRKFDLYKVYVVYMGSRLELKGASKIAVFLTGWHNELQRNWYLFFVYNTTGGVNFGRFSALDWFKLLLQQIGRSDRDGASSYFGFTLYSILFI